MDETGGFAATLLDASAHGLAALTVSLARERVASADDRALVASEDAVSDTEARLRQLAEAAAAGTPDLFAAHVEWSLSTCVARGVSPTFLPTLYGCLAEVLERELPPAAWQSLRPSLDAGRIVLASPPACAESLLDVPSGQPRPHADLANRFLLELLEGRRDAAIELIENAFTGGVPVAELHRHVLAAALEEVGRMWQAGEVHVAEERLATAIVADALALLAQRTPRRAPHAGRVLVASVEGNLHELGARIVADGLAREGWTTFFLGANVPGADLLQSAVDHAVDVLALSVGMGVHVRAAARLIAAAHALPDHRLPVVVGGRILERVPELWRAIGADAQAAGPEEAAAACARLVKSANKR